MIDVAWLVAVREALKRAETALQKADADRVEGILFPLIHGGYLQLQKLGVLCEFGVREVFDYLGRVNEFDFRSFPFLSKVLRDVARHVSQEEASQLRSFSKRVDEIEKALEKGQTPYVHRARSLVQRGPYGP